MKKLFFILLLLPLFACHAQTTLGTVKDGVYYPNVSGGGEVNNDSFTGTALTDGYTFTTSDFTTGRKVFYYDGTTDIEVNLPDVATTGQKIIIWQYNTGKVNVKLTGAATGTNASTVDNTGPITYTKGFASFGYRPVGNWTIYVP